MSTSKSKLTIVMAVYIRMYLVGIIYNLNFTILIVNEIYGRNTRSIQKTGGSKKITSNTGVPRKYRRVGHPRYSA
jgi:hypothetical protein